MIWTLEYSGGKGGTVEFALDGRIYKIDLTTRNGNALRQALAPYVAAARPVKASRPGRTKRIQVGADTRTIKAWARANGYEVADRGRLPIAIRDAFNAAN